MVENLLTTGKIILKSRFMTVFMSDILSIVTIYTRKNLNFMLDITQSPALIFINEAMSIEYIYIPIIQMIICLFVQINYL